MSFFHRKKKPLPVVHWKITRKCLDMILEAAKSTFPNEFGGLLRRDTAEKQVISEVVLLPGTVAGDSHAIFRLHMLPIDFSIIGTVHSHPSPIPRPSAADLELFNHFGRVHVIVAYPYTMTSWNAYDYMGNQIDIQVV